VNENVRQLGILMSRVLKSPSLLSRAKIIKQFSYYFYNIISDRCNNY